MKKLVELQKILKAPKGQYNSFGKYSYRSCEDIVEAVKPITTKLGLILLLSDEIIQIQERIYIKATATLIDSENGEKISVNALAREPQEQKGMNESQITGSASSYARKYALNGLLAIDDTKDADEYNAKNEFITQEEKAYIMKLIKETNSDFNMFLAYLGVNNIDEINRTLFEKAKKALSKKTKNEK